MNSNTLRFGVLRTLAFGGLLIAGTLAGRAAADEPATAVAAPSRVEAQVEVIKDVADIDAATRNDLITKAAATASIAPRGFGLVAPALIVAPAQ